MLFDAKLPVITYIFRRRSPTAFSLEKQFDALFAHFENSGVRLRRLELPHVFTTHRYSVHFRKPSSRLPIASPYSEERDSSDW